MVDLIFSVPILVSQSVWSLFCVCLFVAPSEFWDIILVMFILMVLEVFWDIILVMFISYRPPNGSSRRAILALFFLSACEEISCDLL